MLNQNLDVLDPQHLKHLQRGTHQQIAPQGWRSHALLEGSEKGREDAALDQISVVGIVFAADSSLQQAHRRQLQETVGGTQQPRGVLNDSVADDVDPRAVTMVYDGESHQLTSQLLAEEAAGTEVLLCAVLGPKRRDEVVHGALVIEGVKASIAVPALEQREVHHALEELGRLALDALVLRAMDDTDQRTEQSRAAGAPIRGDEAPEVCRVVLCRE
mmetsp:Transcript_75657/g.216613  ORF Transcript_75657/g.216613 Transcript_75657/m.216613 type:complete len:216 (+) Transcript_75657:1132-1779(+)